MRAKTFVSKVSKISVRRMKKGDEDQGLNISCEVILTYGNHIPTLIKETQERVRDAVEFMTGLMVREINIMVKALYVEA